MPISIAELPPAYQAQALKKLAAQKGKPDALAAAARRASAAGKQFESKGEYEFYMRSVLPRLATGEILRCTQHPRFALYPKGEYDGLQLRAVRYTADFRLDYADGTVEIVEVKSRFVRRMQRDYPLRRRVFLETVARPQGWRFREIITDDTAEDIKRWRKLAQEAKEARA